LKRENGLDKELIFFYTKRLKNVKIFKGVFNFSKLSI
jgi:hypothetical protein